jgi:hypothetical protein
MADRQVTQLLIGDRGSDIEAARRRFATSL